ncbi:DNA repair protein RadC [Lactobacillus sp. PV037]|uniref:JAB domain-containing protein n=1 Tax=unclassified Lactobacillus TaxID=2620435 RepID=UPI00223EDD33|nr:MULTISPECIES: JAB domain-containing protein [unclassified Lactobacillus]QNQ82471.1 DNA repair protein RadC [Lactobacillus sp. PV012]QNQ83415.1 DNA repair protein RadC [Lactobacillus sp. PV037]
MNLEKDHYLLQSDKQLFFRLKEYLRKEKIDNFNQLKEYLEKQEIHSLEDLWKFLTTTDCPEDLTLCLKGLIYRIKRLQNERLDRFSSSAQVGYYLQDKFCGKTQEEVVALYLDSKNRIIAEKLICRGTLNKSLAHPRDIFRWGIIYNAASFIIVHNHPSGDCTPSQQDIDFTKKLTSVSKLVGIDILDHFVVSDVDYYSFREMKVF